VARKPVSDAGNASKTLGDLLYADGSALPPSATEAEWRRLVHAIAAGDQRALRTLYERTHRLVFTLAMRISGSRESAEEITLDVFQAVWKRAPDYDPAGGSVVGWIMNQARSRSIDRVRFEQRKKRVSNPAAHDDQDHVEVDDAADLMSAQQRGALVRDAIAALSPEERQAIETSFFGGLSYSESALRLGQPLGTLKTRVRSALSKLRTVLANEGGES
jgi:RNA polymerase sigma-70 factor, ECF subfamily